jgi:hypothetical protein
MAKTRTLNYSSLNYSLSSDWCFSLPHLRLIPEATAHIYIYIHTYTHARTHTYIYTHTHAHAHTTRAHAHTHIYKHTHTHARTHTYIYIYTHTYTHTINNIIDTLNCCEKPFTDKNNTSLGQQVSIMGTLVITVRNVTSN